MTFLIYLIIWLDEYLLVWESFAANLQNLQSMAIVVSRTHLEVNLCLDETF